MNSVGTISFRRGLPKGAKNLMRRMSLILAAVLPMLVTAPACNKLASRSRVNSINRMNEGIKMEAKNNTSAAERLLKESIEFDPTHAKAHYTLGQIYRKQSKLKDAENAFKDAISHMATEEGGPNADYHYHLGEVIEAQANAEGVSQADKAAKYAEAITAYEETTKVNDKYYKAYTRSGRLYAELDQPLKADAAFRKSIEVKPQYSPAFVSLGHMYIDYGHANVAMSVMDAGVKVNDKDPQMWAGLGRAYFDLGKPDEAIDAYKKAKAIDPEMTDVLFGLGMAYADKRDRKNAVEHLEAFLQKAGNAVPADRKKAATNTVARMQDVI